MNNSAAQRLYRRTHQLRPLGPPWSHDPCNPCNSQSNCLSQFTPRNPLISRVLTPSNLNKIFFVSARSATTRSFFDRSNQLSDTIKTHSDTLTLLRKTFVTTSSSTRTTRFHQKHTFRKHIIIVSNSQTLSNQRKYFSTGFPPSATCPLKGFTKLSYECLKTHTPFVVRVTVEQLKPLKREIL